MNSGDKEYLKIKLSVPKDYEGSSAELLLLVSVFDEVVKTINLPLRITPKGMIHSLIISDYSFNKQNYLLGDTGFIIIEVSNEGDFVEEVDFSFDYAGRIVKSTDSRIIQPGNRASFKLPFSIYPLCLDIFKITS